MKNIVYTKKNRLPADSLLTQYFPLTIWEKVEKQALSSPLVRNGVGTLVLNDANEILAKGTSHMGEHSYHDAIGTHSERHALSKIPKEMREGTTIVNFAVDLKTKKICWNACPCVSCAKHISDSKVRRIVFPKFNIYEERWEVIDTTAEELLDWAGATSGKYARDQRIGF